MPNYWIINGRLYSNDEFYHYGVEGMKWGVRRFQNEDGTLTVEGKRRYSESLSNVYNNNGDDGDYVIPKGNSVFRRTSSIKDSDAANKKYTYAYDYDDPDDDNFYKQFGRKITQYTLADDAVLAGRKTLGKAFLDKMLKLDDEEDIENMDVLYSELRYDLGEKYVKDLFTVPYEPSKHVDALEAAGSRMVAKMLSAQRNETLDEKLKRRGTRDMGTAVNDLGRDIVDKLLADGYSGMRDYNDYDSAAPVKTPTIVFDPDAKLSKLKEWIDD